MFLGSTHLPLFGPAPQILDHKQQPFVLIIEMLNFYLHFINLCGLDILFKTHYDLVLLLNPAMQILDVPFQPQDQRVTALLEVIVGQHLLNLTIFYHSISNFNPSIIFYSQTLHQYYINPVTLNIFYMTSAILPKSNLYISSQLLFEKKNNNSFIVLLSVNMHLYTLATDYQTYLCAKNTQEKENASNGSPINIFDDKALSKNDITTLSNIKSYQIVGFQELKCMENKLRKGKKNTFKKDTFLREDRPFSKQSSQPTQTDLMTKHQLLESLPHIQKPAKSRSNQGNLINSRKYQTEQSHHQDYTREMKNLHQPHEDSQFSLNRIKVAMEQKNEQWKKLMAAMKRENYKFPSILNSSDLYRSKVEERAKNQKTQGMANLGSNRWPEILRKDTSLGEILRSSKIPTTLHKDLLTSRGTSKLRSQNEWLNQKQEQGYRFKKYRESLKKTARKQEGVR